MTDDSGLRDIIAQNHKDIMAAIRGSTDADGTWHPGLAPQVVALGVRVAAIEKIVANCTAFFLAIASLVAGAWALILYGPVGHK